MDAKKQRPDASAVLLRHLEITQTGPLPPPADVEHYEKILPGAAKQFFAALEEESAHRRVLDNKMLDDAIKSGRLGQYFAFTIALVALIATTLIAALKGPTAYAIVPAVVACTGLAAVFLPKRKD